MGTDTVSAIFDIARISEQIGSSNMVTGWTIVAMGMFVVICCLLVIACIVALLPKFLELVNRFFPEKSEEKQTTSAQNASSPVEAVAAAVAIAYHNYHNNGK